MRLVVLRVCSKVLMRNSGALAAPPELFQELAVRELRQRFRALGGDGRALACVGSRPLSRAAAAAARRGWPHATLAAATLARLLGAVVATLVAVVLDVWPAVLAALPACRRIAIWIA